MKLLEYVNSVKKSYKGKNETVNFYFMRSQLFELWNTVRKNNPSTAKYAFRHLENIHHSDDFKLVISYYWFEFIRPSYQLSGSRSAYFKNGKKQIKDYLKEKPAKKLEDYLT